MGHRTQANIPGVDLSRQCGVYCCDKEFLCDSMETSLYAEVFHGNRKIRVGDLYHCDGELGREQCYSLQAAWVG